MPDYTLAAEAEQDLLEIGRYTARTWSFEQAHRYLSALESHFEAIARGDAIEKRVFEHRDDIRVSRCRNHFIFFVRDPELGIVILAVLHEQMDLMARLRDRLTIDE